MYIVINVYLIRKVKFNLIRKVKFKKLCTFLYMICLCCYVSSRRPSDAGSTVTNCSCTLLTGHTEPKSVYGINSLHAGVLYLYHLQVAYTQIRHDIMWEYLDIMMVFSKQSFKNFILKKKSGQQNT